MVALFACVLSQLTRPDINGSNLIPADESFALDGIYMTLKEDNWRMAPK